MHISVNVQPGLQEADVKQSPNNVNCYGVMMLFDI